MNILLISQCTKNALTETRRILDQFAERRGDRTWQTAITLQGLETLHRLLRRTARKNTAVACHWIRGKDHSELLWIVGNAGRFNAQGAVPTNITERDVLRSDDEDDWRHLEDIRLLTSLAALWHDFGKANLAFQNKLGGNARTADAYRHEWVSLRLFAAWVGADDDLGWLKRLADYPERADTRWLSGLQRDGLDPIQTSAPLKNLPPLAQVVGWLILGHHRLPTNSEPGVRLAVLHKIEAYIVATWCGSRAKGDAAIAAPPPAPGRAPAKGAKRKAPSPEAECWQFPHGLPDASRHWRTHVRRVATAILERPALLAGGWLDDPYALHLGRLALMLADHFYSSQPSHARYGDPTFPLYANTQDGQLKQRLDEHLIGVEVNASRLLHTLPRLERQLGRLARHRGFRKPATIERFRWQNRAFDLATALQPRAARQGFFGVNMASTGYGKTLANGRILYALADPRRGARFCIALGLRTLTLQTGDAYRDRLGLGATEMAVLVGGTAVRELHESQRAMQTGSESSAALFDTHDFVHYEGSLEDGPLNRWLSASPQAQRLLNAPIAICTIDHLMPATEGIRGGRQLAPMLRLLSGDLVLDEPDDFDLEDLPALSRLVHLVGLFGGRLLLSSATLPPALVQGLFEAYRQGSVVYRKHRGESLRDQAICCAWFDEFQPDASDHVSADSYATAHRAFVEKRLSALAQAERRRVAVLQPLEMTPPQSRAFLAHELAAVLRERILDCHRLHRETDSATGRRVSVGLIRMANIEPLVLTAQALAALGAPEQTRIHLCVYHARHPLLVRSELEQRLDRLLRRDPPRTLFDDPEVAALLQRHEEPDQILVVMATAVAEVGRDHDYDWAIVEPSSVRSIVQLAGRVRRHRPGAVTAPNLVLLETNLRYLEHGAKEPAFRWPGFERGNWRLRQFRLSTLLTPEQLATIDASLRIRERDPLCPTENLADLEQAALRAWMLGEGAPGTNRVDVWWQTRAMLTGELQRCQPFRADPDGHERYALLVGEDEDRVEFHRYEHDGHVTPVDYLFERLALDLGLRIGFWGTPEYLEALLRLAERQEMDPQRCARRFGYVDLPKNSAPRGWCYHPALGFVRRR